MHRPFSHRGLAWVGSAVVVVGCSFGLASPAHVTIDGSVYTDLRVDLPCDQQVGPAELVGITLSFEGPDRAVLTHALTEPLVVLELPRTAETASWAHGGCRFAAPYRATMPPATTYSVTFFPRDAGAGPDTGFTGVDSLEPQTLRHADLEAAQFVWTFEAPPEFAVP